MENKASSSKLPTLAEVDVSDGLKLVEDHQLRDREAWRAQVERRRERQLMAREIKWQKGEGFGNSKVRRGSLLILLLPLLYFRSLLLSAILVSPVVSSHLDLMGKGQRRLKVL